MTEVLTTRLSDTTAERVRAYARLRRRSVNETVSLALDEWLRQTEFTYIEFRDTRHGRMAYMRNSRLPVYWVIQTVQAYGMDLAKVRAHWPNRPRGWVEAAVEYYRAYPDEIDDQIAQHQAASTPSALRRYLPEVETLELRTVAAAAE
ncbi:MAG: transcriptional regulator [Armatimonadetes bacterium]|nr:transcriptional regulator [Armatimonadota bacterium]